MYFPKFWARGECEGQLSWRWFDRSLHEARLLAESAAQTLADRIRHGDLPDRKRGYYPGRPFREPVLRELKNASGELIAVVTRNSYGCQVLNSARVLFVDVDLPETQPSGGLLKRLFGKPDIEAPDVALNNIVTRVELWTRKSPDWGWRIYRTRAGLRLLATHALLEAGDGVCDEAFEAFDADPLYRQICKAQKCFRARLTPKPWRCGIHEKPERWQWLTLKAETRFEAWHEEYQVVCRQWATCELVKLTGSKEVHPNVRAIIEVHDEATRAESRLALARSRVDSESGREIIH